MNNNSKHRRRVVAKSKAKTVTFQVPHKVAQCHGPDYRFREQTITMGRQARLSKRAKVGNSRNNSRNS